jgi:hypothetical protein
LVGLAFTQPGRAFTGDIGRIVGIGDEPTEPPSSNAIVIGVGESATYPYEITAFSDNPSDVCIGPQFPGIPGFQVADCATDAALRDLADKGIRAQAYGVPDALYPDAELLVQGELRSDAASVEVAYTSVDGTSHEGTASISELDDALARKLDVSEESKFFVAFLPPEVLEPPDQPGGPLTVENAQQGLDDIRVTARDASGAVVGSKVLGATPKAAERLSMFLSPAGRFAGPTDFDAPPGPSPESPRAGAN